MNLERFLSRRSPDWNALDELMALKRPAGPELIRLGALYRSAAADLSFARRKFASDPVVETLESTVARARAIIYSSAVRRESFWSFLTTGYWRRITEQPLAVGLAALLLFGPLLFTLIWGWVDPSSASGVIGGRFNSVSNLGFSADDKAAISGIIFTNNIRVTFLAFALGITAGIGTAVILVVNGATIGTLVGIALAAGHGSTVVELLVPHGVLELSCIVVTAAAGLRMGRAIVDPGRHTRRSALAHEGRRSVEIALGTVPWLVVAGLIEGFLTPSGLGLGLALTIGLFFGGAFAVLIVWRGLFGGAYQVSDAGASLT